MMYNAVFHFIGLTQALPNLILDTIQISNHPIENLVWWKFRQRCEGL